MSDRKHMLDMYREMPAAELANEYLALDNSLLLFLSGEQALTDSPVREYLDEVRDIILTVIAWRYAELILGREIKEV